MSLEEFVLHYKPLMKAATDALDRGDYEVSAAKAAEMVLVAQAQEEAIAEDGRFHRKNWEVFAHFLRGHAMTNLDPERACAAYARVLEIEREHPGAGSDGIIKGIWFEWLESYVQTPYFEDDAFDALLARAVRAFSDHDCGDQCLQMAHKRARTLRLAGRFDAAAHAAEDALARKRMRPEAPGCDLAHYLRDYGCSLLAVGKLDAASRVFDEVIELGESYGWLLRGEVELREGRLDAALEQIQEGLARGGSAAWWHPHALALGERTEDARAIAQKIWIAERDARAAIFLSARGGDEGAVQAAAKGETHLPWHADLAAFWVGELSARALLRRAARVSSESLRNARLAEAHFHLGFRATAHGRKKRAQTQYRACIDTPAPTNVERSIVELFLAA